VLVTGANTNDSLVFEALLDDLPPTRTPAGRRRCRPDKCHADKAYDHRRCRGYLTRRGVWLFCRDCLTWETSGSAVGRGAAAPLGAEREDRFVPNQPPAGTTILPTGIAQPAAGAALAVRNSPLNPR
jgi:hypothetical protein